MSEARRHWPRIAVTSFSWLVLRPPAPKGSGSLCRGHVADQSGLRVIPAGRAGACRSETRGSGDHPKCLATSFRPGQCTPAAPGLPHYSWESRCAAPSSAMRPRQREAKRDRRSTFFDVEHRDLRPGGLPGPHPHMARGYPRARAPVSPVFVCLALGDRDSGP